MPEHFISDFGQLASWSTEHFQQLPQLIGVD